MGIIEHYENEVHKTIINRPHRGNSLDLSTLIAIKKSILDAQSNPYVKVIVLTGHGLKDFTTGIDLKEAKQLPKHEQTNIGIIAGDIATLLYHGKPSIVALNGRTMGMGVVFAVAADYRIAVDDVLIQMPEINSAIFPGARCTIIMTRVCGLAWTRKLLLFGEPITITEAKEANIVDQTTNKQEFEKLVIEMANKLVTKDKITLQKIKLAINNSFDITYGNMVDLESELMNDNDNNIESIKKKRHLDLKFFNIKE